MMKQLESPSSSESKDLSYDKNKAAGQNNLKKRKKNSSMDSPTASNLGKKSTTKKPIQEVNKVSLFQALRAARKSNYYKDKACKNTRSLFEPKHSFANYDSDGLSVYSSSGDEHKPAW